ncbi:MAG: hypothetical protein JO142_11490 [Burkholderiales bacterium]|nr:hypothetical protein [Burkholderiales bacterium]
MPTLFKTLRNATIAIVLTATSPAYANPVTVDWQAAAKQDIRFAIDSIRDRHAGAVSQQLNVTVPLEIGARVGLVEAEKVRTEQDYRRLMQRFISGFGDPHTGIDVHLKTRAWTGLMLDHIDGQYRVVWSEQGWPTPLPPKGAIVQSCDDVWVGTYLQSNVAPFVNHSVEYPTTFSELARKVMFDTGLGWTPAQCLFQLADGKHQRFALPLRQVSDGIGIDKIIAVRAQVAAKAKPVGLYPLAEGIQWVGMPNFDGQSSGTAYEALYRQLAALDKTDWIVFDLRGNGGGDSSWGNRALQAVYGKAYGEALGENASYAKAMIADQATVDLFKRFVSQPEYAASREEFKAAISKLEAALREGKKMAQVEAIAPDTAAAHLAQYRVRPSGPRMAAVIDRGCFSSCMNFLLQITAVTDTVVLGEPTIGYSPYGEINRFDLPSGQGALYIASAVYTSFQAAREPFIPNFTYSGNMASTEELMHWVGTTLKNLAPRR